MTGARLTKTIVLVAAVVAIVLDIVFVLNRTPGDTFSAVITGWSWRYQSVPFGLGVIGGHLFWPAEYARMRSARRQRLGWLVAACAAAIFVDWTVCVMVPTWPVIAGAIVGRLTWAQPPP